jgi:hypothetical protein
MIWCNSFVAKVFLVKVTPAVAPGRIGLVIRVAGAIIGKPLKERHLAAPPIRVS